MSFEWQLIPVQDICNKFVSDFRFLKDGFVIRAKSCWVLAAVLKLQFVAMYWLVN
jgi:hypothetical protein